MEFATEQDSFQPVVIKLTTQAEVDFFYDLIAGENISGVYGVVEESLALFDHLEQFVSGDLEELDNRVTHKPANPTNHMHECVGPLLMRISTNAQEVGECSEHPCKGGCEACVGCNASDSQEHFEAVKQPGKFEPFYLRVEDQATANYLAALVGSCTSQIDKAFGVDDTAYDLYDYIADHASGDHPRLDTKLISNN